MLKESEPGAAVTAPFRKDGMSNATCDAWKCKYGGLEVSETKRLQAGFEMSERRACAMIGDDWTSMRCRSCRDSDGDLRA